MSTLPKMTLRFSRDLKIFFNENHDNCTVCKRSFNDHELTHLGYDFSDSFIYACNECSSKVKETVVRYSYSKRSYEIPLKTNYLWRYMDFSKFVSMLHKQCLYFTKSSLFKDPFEGAIGILDNKQKYEDSEVFGLLYAVLTPLPNSGILIPDNEIVQECFRIIKAIKEDTATESDRKSYEQATRLSGDMAQARPKMREFTFVNCWHENQFESDAMWLLYSKDVSNAIAIRSTYDKMYLSMDKNPDIQIGRVNYIDYNKSFSSTNSTYWYKRMSFSHEREVRAVTINPSFQDKLGIEVPINLNTLIDKIYISPQSGDWFVDIVKDILKRYGLDKEILHSDLSKKPMY